MTAFQFHAPLHTTACATAVSRRSTSSVASSATCHETFHDARHHALWRHLPSNSSSPKTCRVQWHVPLPSTVAAHTPPPPSESSQTTRFLVGTAYCAVHYHYHYCTPTRTSLNATTARWHIPPSRLVSRDVTAQSHARHTARCSVV